MNVSLWPNTDHGVIIGMSIIVVLRSNNLEFKLGLVL